MKTKKLFLMAAMLLTSMCAFAQSENNEPLKGDVNEDGKVDVADITALVKIIMENGGGSQEETTYYYYAGWTLPTVDNVESIIAETYPTSKTDNTQHAAGKKTTNPSTFSLASVNLYNSEAKTNYYVLVPTGHAIYDTVFGLQMGTASFTSQGTITVGNQVHTIYKSVDTTRNIGSIEIRISDAPTYYWYVGYNQDAYEHPESFKANMYTTTTNAIPTEYTVSGDNGLDVSGTGTRPNYLIMIIPSTWSKPTIYCQLKDGEVGMTLEKQNVTITGISGVTFNVYSGTGENSDSKVYIN